MIGREFCAVRPTTLIGPGERPRASRPHTSNFNRLVEAARAGRPVQLLHADAREDVLAVDDAAEAVVALWQRPAWDDQAFAVSTGAICSLADLAAAVTRETGLQVTTTAETVVDGGADLPAIVANARLTAATGWRPQRSLDAIVREYLDEAGD